MQNVRSIHACFSKNMLTKISRSQVGFTNKKLADFMPDSYQICKSDFSYQADIESWSQVEMSVVSEFLTRSFDRNWLGPFFATWFRQLMSLVLDVGLKSYLFCYTYSWVKRIWCTVISQESDFARRFFLVLVAFSMSCASHHHFGQFWSLSQVADQSIPWHPARMHQSLDNNPTLYLSRDMHGPRHGKEQIAPFDQNSPYHPEPKVQCLDMSLGCYSK